MFEIIDIRYADSHVRVDLDTGESFFLLPEIFRIYSIQKGGRIDRNAYLQLKEESDRFLCGRKALDYLSKRSRSGLEVETFLGRKGFSSDIINEVILKITKSGYIDDYKFAINYINYQTGRKAVGESLLKRELYRKGVNGNIIKRAISETKSDVADPDGLYRLALKKLQGIKNRKNIESKLVFFLRQRGFHVRDIRSVIENLKSDGCLGDGIQDNS